MTRSKESKRVTPIHRFSKRYRRNKSWYRSLLQNPIRYAFLQMMSNRRVGVPGRRVIRLSKATDPPIQLPTIYSTPRVVKKEKRSFIPVPSTRVSNISNPKHTNSYRKLSLPLNLDTSYSPPVTRSNDPIATRTRQKSKKS